LPGAGLGTADAARVLCGARIAAFGTTALGGFGVNVPSPARGAVNRANWPLADRTRRRAVGLGRGVVLTRASVTREPPPTASPAEPSPCCAAQTGSPVVVL